jgi:1-deoxy-D-xylulose-5-phosphate reductoisomerase
MSSPPLNIGILGSTGSIGQSTLQVVDRFPERLRVTTLAASRNVETLAAQVRKYRPEVVALADSSKAEALLALLGDYTGQIVFGAEGLDTVATWPSLQTLVVAVVGFAGAGPTLAAIDAGKNIALANKETLVAAGAVVMPSARRRGVTIAPIDSEHSAIWQCLRAGERHEVRRIILTASGGPFRTRPLGTFDSITPQEALAHPTWRMGPRITIDSATMMNKAFEIIEATWLFDLTSDQIDLVIHPQSIVHSMVEYLDGSVIAQLGSPDMTLPITYALFAPSRPDGTSGPQPLDITKSGALEFLPPDLDRYPALSLARRALAIGPTAGAVLNAADEVAVAAFLDGRIPFTRIIEAIEETLDAHQVVQDPDFDDIMAIDQWARRHAADCLANASSKTVASTHGVGDIE